LFAILANHLVGSSDLFTALLVVVVALIMKPVILEFQMGGRELMANHFKEASNIQEIIKKPGLLSHIFSIFAALTISTGLIVLLKGVVLSHGLLSFLTLLFVITLALFPILGQGVNKKIPSGLHSKGEKANSAQTFDEGLHEASKSSAIEHHLVTSASRYASFVASLVIGIIVLNLAMALLLSAKDTFIFLASEVTFDNFDELALADAIAYNGENMYSRAIINAYILGDVFRLALANSVFSVLVSSGDKERFFYFFYILVLFLNLIKLVPFSIGIVLFLRGVRRHSDSIQKWSSESYRSIKNWAEKRRGMIQSNKNIGSKKASVIPQKNTTLNQGENQ